MPSRIEIRYAGVNLSTYPKWFPKTLPGGRYNYFEVPWNAACPGFGNVLVTSTQLAAIKASVDEILGGDLELHVFDEEDKKVDVESVTLKNIVPIRALPIWGEFFRSKDVDSDGFPVSSESLGGGDVGVHDTPSNAEGLWCLELQDRRTSLISTNWVPLDKGAFNVQIGPMNGTYFVETTAANINSGWSTKEILDQIKDSSVQFTYTGDSIDALPKVYDVFVAAIPALIACDLLLAATLQNLVFKFDPTDTNPLATFNIVKLDKDCSPLLKAYAPLRMFGGSDYLFYWFKNPKGSAVIRNRLGSSTKDFSDYYKGKTPTPQDSDALIPFVRGTTSSYPADPINYREKQTYRGVYRGFCKGFLTNEYPISLVVFNWANNVPTTEITIGRQSPIRTLLEGPIAHFLRDIPSRVSINGDIGIPDSPGDFVAVITKCSDDFGYAEARIASGDPPNVTVDANAPTIKLFVAKNPFARAGDPVFVRSFTSGSKLKYYMTRMMIDPLSPYKAPTAAEKSPTQDTPALDAHCPDTIMLP